MSNIVPGLGFLPRTEMQFLVRGEPIFAPGFGLAPKFKASKAFVLLLDDPGILFNLAHTLLQ